MFMKSSLYPLNLLKENHDMKTMNKIIQIISYFVVELD